jgi:hypothetical protein
MQIHGSFFTIPLERDAWNRSLMRDNDKIVTRTMRQVNCVVADKHVNSVPQSRRAARTKRFPSRVVLRLSAPLGQFRPSGSPDVDARDQVDTVNQVTCVPGRLSAPHDDLAEYNDSSTIWIRDK